MGTYLHKQKSVDYILQNSNRLIFNSFSSLPFLKNLSPKPLVRISTGGRELQWILSFLFCNCNTSTIPIFNKSVLYLYLTCTYVSSLNHPSSLMLQIFCDIQLLFYFLLLDTFTSLRYPQFLLFQLNSHAPSF